MLVCQYNANHFKTQVIKPLSDTPLWSPHLWSDWIITTSANCATKGIETRTCQVSANHTETRPTEDIDPSVHLWDDIVVINPATCLNNGTGMLVCKDNVSHFEMQAIPASHSFGEWTIKILATVEEYGQETRECSRDSCNESEIRPTAKLDKTSITKTKKSNKSLFKATIVSDKMEIILDGRVNFVVYDMTGNVVANADGKTWDLRNSAGRFVANGSYLVVVEKTSRDGKVSHYSAKIGVKR
jgi:hypothetical protein